MCRRPDDHVASWEGIRPRAPPAIRSVPTISGPSVLREIGEPQNVSPHSAAAKPPKKRARLDTPTEMLCEVCFDTLGVDDMFKLRCGHTFCKPCWRAYVTAKIKDEGECLFKCMQDGCLTYVDDGAVKKLVPKATYER